MRKSTKIISIFGFLCLVWIVMTVWPKNLENQEKVPLENPQNKQIAEMNSTTTNVVTPTNTSQTKTPLTTTVPTKQNVTNTSDPIPNSTPTPQQIFATLSIDQKQYPIYTTTDTLYQIIQKINQQNDAQIKTRTFPGMGEFVEEINGVANDKLAGKYWIYYVNGVTAQIGISQYIPKQNDLIEWKYEIQKF